MAYLYADENVPPALVEALQALGHNVLSARDDGRAHQGVPDANVLARATALGRAVLTNNGWDYIRLHGLNPSHAGIVVYTDQPSDRRALAARIDAAVAVPSLANQLLRVNLPNRPPPRVP